MNLSPIARTPQEHAVKLVLDLHQQRTAMDTRGYLARKLKSLYHVVQEEVQHVKEVISRSSTSTPTVPTATDWEYHGRKGPAYWHLIQGATGAHQSPVDFVDNSLEFDHLEFTPTLHYFNAPKGTGNSVQGGHVRLSRVPHRASCNSLDLHDHALDVTNTGHSVQINFPTDGDVGGYVAFKNVMYNLKQIHFHSPSEHKVKGKSYRMEVHFVHQSEEKELLVIGMFIAVAEEARSKTEPANFLDFLLHEVPKIKQKGVHDYIPPHTIDLEQAAQLIDHETSYYVYDGSLTTPPFTEGVHWIVCQTPCYMRRALIHAIEAGMPKRNARPVQKTSRKCERPAIVKGILPTLHDWAYDGPKGPAFWHLMQGVKIGSHQSPIDFIDATLEFEHDDFAPMINWHNATTQGPSIENGFVTLSRNMNTRASCASFEDAETVLNHLQNHTLNVTNTGHSVQINFPAGGEVGGHVLFEGEEYVLKQLHFHSPAEHKVHGTQHRMEAHFVHLNEDGGLLVIGLFVDVAEDADEEPVDFLDFLLDEVPKVRSKGEHEYVPPHTIDLEQAASLIDHESSYYCYDGSLTTPPFTEGVHWIVGNSPVFMRRALIEAIESGLPKGNARPCQPTKNIRRPSLSAQRPTLKELVMEHMHEHSLLNLGERPPRPSLQQDVSTNLERADSSVDVSTPVKYED